jgi:hypothetical protein
LVVVPPATLFSDGCRGCRHRSGGCVWSWCCISESQWSGGGGLVSSWKEMSEPIVLLILVVVILRRHEEER